MKKPTTTFIAVIVALLVAGFFVFVFTVHAQTEGELRSKIDVKNAEIVALEKEIAEFQAQIVAVGKQANTLESALASLELSRKKLTTDITLTEKKIDAVTLTIESLKGEISDKEQRIGAQHAALSKSLRDVADADQTSLAEAILIYESLGDFWNEEAARDQLHSAIGTKVRELELLKNDLGVAKDDTEKKRRELQALRAQLGDQRKIVEDNKRQTDKLLKDTKSTEANYKKILAQRQAKRDALAQELNAYETQLRLIIDPSSFPKPSSGILSWPVDNPLVTQEFGDTAFSRQNPQAYSGKGHNAIDLRASPGTPIFSALAGQVVGTGDTDLVCPGASYGRWVLIKHANGLTTLYAHLSLIKVSQGQQVGTRELIGYSGITGYATGPHLHFSVYASQGVQVTALKSRVCGGTYTIPVADLKAYLNPLLYL